eukprot:TRINITY_DN80588_c0_g1_i1.p1 TRINITY_DN80588_c0_g1~~TRINITY_DN80588_c0_g1_i1.p1  ORF type:complete len:704 (+),score=131.68 TRINITY_DN80588_c0_g1_i1:263-2113(+)
MATSGAQALVTGDGICNACRDYTAAALSQAVEGARRRAADLHQEAQHAAGSEYSEATIHSHRALEAKLRAGTDELGSLTQSVREQATQIAGLEHRASEGAHRQAAVVQDVQREVKLAVAAAEARHRRLEQEQEGAERSLQRAESSFASQLLMQARKTNDLAVAHGHLLQRSRGLAEDLAQERRKRERLEGQFAELRESACAGWRRVELQTELNTAYTAGIQEGQQATRLEMQLLRSSILQQQGATGRLEEHVAEIRGEARRATAGSLQGCPSWQLAPISKPELIQRDGEALHGTPGCSAITPWARAVALNVDREAGPGHFVQARTCAPHSTSSLPAFGWLPASDATTFPLAARKGSAAQDLRDPSPNSSDWGSVVSFSTEKQDSFWTSHHYAAMANAQIHQPSRLHGRHPPALGGSDTDRACGYIVQVDPVQAGESVVEDVVAPISLLDAMHHDCDVPDNEEALSDLDELRLRLEGKAAACRRGCDEPMSLAGALRLDEEALVAEARSEYRALLEEVRAEVAGARADLAVQRSRAVLRQVSASDASRASSSLCQYHSTAIPRPTPAVWALWVAQERLHTAASTNWPDVDSAYADLENAIDVVCESAVAKMTALPKA